MRWRAISSGPLPPSVTDTTPPTVTGVTPADGATSVSAAASVTATFSEAMAAASITTTNFELRNAAGAAVASAVTYDAAARTATLTPSAALTPGATFTATVKGGTGGVRDVAGNVAATNTVWSFSVATQTSTGPVAVYGFDEATGSVAERPLGQSAPWNGPGRDEAARALWRLAPVRRRRRLGDRSREQPAEPQHRRSPSKRGSTRPR